MHRLIGTDTSKGFAILTGLRDWEHGRVCSEVSVASKQYKAGEWPRMGHVGCIEAEGEGVWARIVGGDWEGGGKMKELKEDNPPPPPLQGQRTTSRTPGQLNWWQENL